MFTGVIEATGRILNRTESELQVERPTLFDDLQVGHSIAVSGVCLTITRLEGGRIFFDVVSETWTRTNLADKEVGDCVNLERSMKANDRFEGHIVQGHVEGTGMVTTLTKDPQDTSCTLTLDIPDNLLTGIIPKGSIAIDGVSLTIASIEQNFCSISLIPHTLAITTLGSLQTGDRVNIETDLLGRYARRLVSLQG